MEKGGGAQDSMNPAMYPQSHFKALVLLVIVCLKTPIVLRSQILVSHIYKIPKLTTEYWQTIKLTTEYWREPLQNIKFDL